MTWTVVSDAALAVNKPARSADIKAIRDNITALANGDAGAPQIQISALVTGTLPVTSLEAPTAGSTYNLKTVGGTVTLRDTIPFYEAVPIGPATILIAGSVRATGTISAFLTIGSIRVYKNGALLTTWTTNSGTVTHTLDITVAVGDVISFDFYGGSGSYDTTASDVKILSSTLSLGVN